jgi:hypothetical protein
MSFAATDPTSLISLRVDIMIQKKHRRGARRGTGKRRQNVNSGNLGMAGPQPDPRGDIPHTPKRTYVTSSIRVPKTTQLCTFRQLVDFTDIVESNTGSVAHSYYFDLASLDFSSNFANVWDQYRITAVKFSIVPVSNAIQVPTQGTTNFVQLYCVIDYDDATNLSNAPAARGYDNCIELQPGESLERTFAPRAALAAYAGAFNNYANVAEMWIDTVSTGTQHYGIKTFVPGGDASQTLLQTWRVFAEIYISFRSVR